MKLLNAKEAAQAIKDGKTLVIESHPNESGETVTIQMSAKDFEEGEDIELTISYLGANKIAIKNAMHLFAEAKKDMALQDELCNKYKVALEDLKSQYPQGIYLFDWESVDIFEEEEEGEDLPEVVYYGRHCSNLEGKLVGLEPNGHIRLYNDGYVIIEPSYLHPTEFLNVYYHLLAKLSYEES